MEGWLIEDAPKEILLLDWYGEVHTLRKPAPAEKRPKLKEEKDGAVLWDSEADHSVAWNVRKEDYNAKSKKFLADGLPQDKNEDRIFGFVNRRFGLAYHIVNAARYAHFAHQFGQKDHAEALYSHALKAYKKYADHYLGGFDQSAALPVFVASQIASGYRNWAISSANNGASRKELKTQWEKIARIPYHQYRDEAKAMAKHYKNLLEEDARWTEPDAEKFAKFTTEQKIAYWLYHLRDLDVEQSFDPGRCIVVCKLGICLGSRKSRTPNAAVELQKLGLAAVPQLIEHLDDARPTRCKGHWRSYWPEGHYLLRYGDCCQQIFESITGHTIFRGTTTVSYPIHDGEEQRCKEKAEKWWQEFQKKNPKMK